MTRKRTTGTPNRTEVADDSGFGGNWQTATEILGDLGSGETDFPFGHNAPQDSQDLQESHDSKGLSSTYKEKQGLQSPTAKPEIGYSSQEEIPAPRDFDFASWVRRVYESREEQPEPDPENWHSPLFYFARFVKAHPAIIELPDYAAARKVEEIMCQWLPRGVASDPWEYFFPEADDGDAAQLDFMSSWNAVRHVPFHDVLSNALRLADAKPLEPPHQRGKLYQRFISLAGWLQVLLGEQTILLPTRKLGKPLDCDQRTVSRMRKFAEEDGLLVTVKAHSYRTGGKGEATEFRFAIERYPELAG